MKKSFILISVFFIAFCVNTTYATCPYPLTWSAYNGGISPQPQVFVHPTGNQCKDKQRVRYTATDPCYLNTTVTISIREDGTNNFVLLPTAFAGTSCSANTHEITLTQGVTYRISFGINNPPSGCPNNTTLFTFSVGTPACP